MSDKVSPLKRRKTWVFSSPDESWHGDCPSWVAAMRHSRPDLTEHVEVWLRSRWRCAACEQGSRH